MGATPSPWRKEINKERYKKNSYTCIKLDIQEKMIWKFSDRIYSLIFLKVDKKVIIIIKVSYLLKRIKLIDYKIYRFVEELPVWSFDQSIPHPVHTSLIVRFLFLFLATSSNLSSIIVEIVRELGAEITRRSSIVSSILYLLKVSAVW